MRNGGFCVSAYGRIGVWALSKDGAYGTDGTNVGDPWV